MAGHGPWTMLVTTDDSAILDEIGKVLKGHRVGDRAHVVISKSPLVYNARQKGLWPVHEPQALSLKLADCCVAYGVVGRMNQRYDLFAFSLLVGSVALFVFATIFAPNVGGVYGFLRDWQTLIAGTFAIFAAIIAAHPVRKQLSRMNIQSSIMARQVLVERLLALEKRQAISRASLDSITSKFSRDIYCEDQWSEDPEPTINSHWAFDAWSRRGVGWK